MKNRIVVQAVLAALPAPVATLGRRWLRILLAFSALAGFTAAPAALASQLVLNSTGGTMTLGTDFVLTGSTVASPSGTLSIDCPITSVSGSTTLTYSCTGGSFGFQSTDNSTTVAATFGSAAVYLSAAGGGKGGNVKYYYTFNGNFRGIQTVNGIAAAILGETTVAINPLSSQIGSGSATACCAAAGINSAYSPVYITDYSNSQLVRSDDLLGTNKRLLGSTGTGTKQFYGPHGVTVDSSGRIYVVDTFNCRVVRMDNITGANWTTLGSCGSGNRQFSDASDIALDASGRIYVADTGNNRIIRSDDMLGTNWISFGTAGARTNQLSGVLGVAVDAGGKIYIADTGNKRLVRVDDMAGTNWTVLTQSPNINGYIYSFGAPSHVTLDPAGRVVVGDGTNVIRVDDITGANWAGFNVGTAVEGISVDAGGTTFVAGTTSSGGAGLVMFDDVTTGAGFNSSNLVAMTGGIYAIPVPAPVPAVTLAPSLLTFGNQNTGTVTAPQNIVLTNFGTAPLNIANSAVTGDFAQTSTCGSSLPGGSNCSIAVTYAPQVTGAAIGALTVTDNAFTGTQTVALFGTGTAPAAGIAPSSLTFQPQSIGTMSGGQVVFLSNTGTGPLTLSGSGIAVSGDFAQSNNCGAALAPGKLCSIAVTFTPAASGARTGTLSITSNAALQTVTLSGIGASAALNVTVAPESLAFPTQLVNVKSAAQTVTLANSGPKAVSLTSAIVTGDFAKTGRCPASLGAGKSCTLYLTFTPTAAGIRTGALTFALSSSTLTVALTGTGVSTATGWLTFTPASLTFAGYAVGDHPTQAIAVTNTSGAPAGIAGITSSGSGRFSHVSGCGATVAAYATCTIAVTFTPLAVGTFTGTLIITESAGAKHRIPLSGTASTDSGGGN
jgi:sugar lactone lactonase YvrE